MKEIYGRQTSPDFVCTCMHVQPYMHVCVCVWCVCSHSRVSVGTREGFCFATSLVGKAIAVITVKHVASGQQWQLCHHLDVCAVAASADALRLFCQGFACQTTQTICSHQQQYPHPSLSRVTHRRSTTDISVRISTACAWRWWLKGGDGMLCNFDFTNNRY